MNKKLFTGIVITMLVAIIILVNKPSAQANPSTVTGSYLNNNVATTSVTFFTSNSASSTLVLNTDRADQVDINIQGIASSSATNFLWMVDFSNTNADCINVTAACDWFRESVNNLSLITPTTTTNLIVEAPLPFHSWIPGGTATSTKNVVVNLIASKWTRVSFQSTVANGSIWAQGIVKTQRP